MITEQELKGKIAKIIYNDWGVMEWSRLMERERNVWRETANQIHTFYKQAGYVRLCEDQSLPPIPRQDICHIIMERDTMLREAGFRKVE